MYTHEVQKRVRYGETDQMGYLYYGRYADYYEIGRVEMLRSIGLTYRDMEEKHRIMLPVASMHIRYIRPARYDDLLTIRTTLRRWPGKDMHFYTEIFNEEYKLINGAQIRLVFVDMNTMKTTHAPEYFLEKLRPFFITK